MNHLKIMMSAVLILLCLLAGCSVYSGRYGSIILDDTARKSFESFKVDSSMNYYYSGSDASPNAIIGLKKEYELDNDLWKPVKPDDMVFKRLVRGIQHIGDFYQMPLHGFVMKDDQGKPIGIWYSVLSVKTRILKMGKENKVVVYTPELDVYPLGRGASDR